MGLTLRNNLGLRGYRKAGILSGLGALIRAAFTAIFTLFGVEADKSMGAITGTATTGQFTFVGVEGMDSTTLLGFGQTAEFTFTGVIPSASFGAISRAATTPDFTYTGVEPSAGFGAISGAATTPSITLTAQDATFTIGDITGVATTPSITLTAQDATPVFGAISETATTPQFTYIEVDGVGVLGTLTRTATTPSITLTAQDATFTVGAFSATATTPSITLAAQDPSASFGAISASATTPQFTYTEVDGVAVLGAITGTATTPSITLTAQDPTAGLGALTRAATTPSITLTAQDATGDVGSTGPFDDWDGYYEVTSANAQVPETFTDVVAWFDLGNAPSTFWDNIQTDGDDIRVGNSAGDTEYPIYLCYIDHTAEKGLLAAKVPGPNSGSDTTYRIYVDNTAATKPGDTDANGRNAVFDWMFEAAFALFSTTDTADLTGNGHTLTIGSGLAQVETGWFGRGLEATGTQTDDQISIADSGSDLLSLAEASISWTQHKDGTDTANDPPWGWGGGDRCRHQTGVYKFRLGGSQYAEVDPTDDGDDHLAFEFHDANDSISILERWSSRYRRYRYNQHMADIRYASHLCRR